MASRQVDRLQRLADRQPRICPSLLNCDFGRLREEIESATTCGTDIVHWDVMDGVFCPNFTYGPPVIASLRPQTDALFDVHLMVTDPSCYLREFLDAGSDLVTIHIEAVPDPVPLLRTIREAGVWAGLALNPPTPVERIVPYLAEVDLVLAMSVMPGFGGQSFDPVALHKARQIKGLRPDCWVEVDGGINSQTINSAREAGIDLFVVGSAFYKSDNRAEVFRDLRQRVSSVPGAG